MNVREEVAWFAEEMEKQLKANDHKGGWQNCSPYGLVGGIAEELAELGWALDCRPIQCNCQKFFCEHWSQANRQRVIKEAADVANFAMMIADLARR